MPRTSTRMSAVITAKVSSGRRCATSASSLPSVRRIAASRALPSSDRRAGPSTRKIAPLSSASRAAASAANTIGAPTGTRAGDARRSIAERDRAAHRFERGVADRRRGRRLADAQPEHGHRRGGRQPERRGPPGTASARAGAGATCFASRRSTSICIRRVAIASGAAGTASRSAGTRPRQSAARSRQLGQPSMWEWKRTLSAGSRRASTASTKRASTSAQRSSVTRHLPTGSAPPRRVAASAGARCAGGRRARAPSPRSSRR